MGFLRHLSVTFLFCLLMIPAGGIAQENESEQPAIRIVMVGDSTMATYTMPPEDRPDLTGWGQVFGDRFNQRVTIINHAQSGRSSKSFVNEGRWARALEEKPDYIFIQFGHNDGPGKGDRSTHPGGDFLDYLRTYIDGSRAAGAKPILVTPMTRRKFQGGKIVTTLRPYADAMLIVGKEKGVPVIDLHASSVILHNKLGERGGDFFDPSATDRTHFSRKGAQEIARLVAEELRSRVPALRPYLKSVDLRNGKPDTTIEDRPYPTPKSPIARLRTEGIRAKSRGRVERMETARFNLVLPWGGQLLENATKTSLPNSETILSPRDFSGEAVGELREWACESKKHRQIMMHMIYVAGESSIRFLSGIDGDLRKYVRTGEGAEQLWPAHQYRHVVDWDGHAARWAPCPLERRYWMGFIRPQLELVARILRETGATGGAALELETYCFYSIYPGMASQKKMFCFCDHCFEQFLHSIDRDSRPKDLPVDKRFDWLTRQGLRATYDKTLEDLLAGLIREILIEVRKIHPDFVFGFYPYAPFWYYDGLIRGSGSPRLPCLVFPSAEYDGGFTTDSPRTFFGDVSTPASLKHFRRRNLPAMYAGGLWTRAMDSPRAVATAMDRMLRAADGYWVYDRVADPFWEQAGAMNRWSTANPGPLPRGDVTVDALAEAVSRPGQIRQEGIFVLNDQIHVKYASTNDDEHNGKSKGKNGNKDGVFHLFGNEADAQAAYHARWQGRGALPALDDAVFHSGASSIRFQPSAPSDTARSPFIDCKISASQAAANRRYELSFWTRGIGEEPIRFWVGQADSKQHPAYMYYHNFVLEPGKGWRRARIGVRYKDNPPLVIRFWTPPTEGALWLDDVRLEPVRPRTISIPIKPPAEAKGWGAIDWQLSPADARYEATIVDAQDGHPLRTRLYPGDSLSPLDAVVELVPVVLRLQVFPSPEESITLNWVRVGFARR